MSAEEMLEETDDANNKRNELFKKILLDLKNLDLIAEVKSLHPEERCKILDAAEKKDISEIIELINDLGLQSHKATREKLSSIIFDRYPAPTVTEEKNPFTQKVYKVFLEISKTIHWLLSFLGMTKTPNTEKPSSKKRDVITLIPLLIKNNHVHIAKKLYTKWRSTISDATHGWIKLETMMNALNQENEKSSWLQQWLYERSPIKGLIDQYLNDRAKGFGKDSEELKDEEPHKVERTSSNPKGLDANPKFDADAFTL